MLKALKLSSGPLSSILVTYLLYQETGDYQMARMGGIAVWMATWWILESVSLYLTALLPLVLFPFTGIMSMQETAPLYTHEIIFLFLGGFLLAFSVERWNLHRRMAWGILKFTGESALGVLTGVMLTAWFLSMWMSNIATLLMLIPAVKGLGETGLKDADDTRNWKFNTALLLGLAYACSLGGIATLVGTAPNMIFLAFYEKHFPESNPVTFLSWMKTALPISALMLMTCIGILNAMFLKPGLQLSKTGLLEFEVFKDSKPMSRDEKWVGGIFVATILLWCFREDIDLGRVYIPGWSRLLPWPEMIKDSTVAMLMAFVLLMLPDQKGSTLLTWKEVQSIPLGILFLFGGGFALAEGIQSTGLSDWLGSHLHNLKVFSPFMIIVLLSVFMTFFTELTSNTAATYIILPIVLSLVQSLNMPPLQLLLPVVLSASMAFMLPIATPPNTVIFATEKIRMRDMIVAGLWMNLAGVIIISGLVWLIH
jgi:sodium-dependent dicarboxylate transporter 2/3/5